MHVGDTITARELIAAWRADMIAYGLDTDASERSRIAQAAFGIDLGGNPPELAQAWMPDWVRDRTAFDESLAQNGRLLAGLAREWAGLTDDADPFEGMIEAPLVIGALWEHYATDGRTPDIEAMLTDLACALWNIDPDATALVTTTAMYRTGPAARIVKTPPGRHGADRLPAVRMDRPRRRDQHRVLQRGLAPRVPALREDAADPVERLRNGAHSAGTLTSRSDGGGDSRQHDNNKRPEDARKERQRDAPDLAGWLPSGR